MDSLSFSEKSAARASINDTTLSVIDLDLDKLSQSEPTKQLSKAEKKQLEKQKKEDQMEKEWHKYTSREKLFFILNTIFKLLIVAVLLYMFLLSLNFLTIGFTLVAQYALRAKDTFGFLLDNPFAALAIGIFFTSILQDCTATISISVTLVGAGIISLKKTVPVIIGANIGSCVTNSLMAMTLTANDLEFKRGFSAATLIDIFNYLTASVLLAVEILFGFMTFLSDKLASLMPDDPESMKKFNFVSALVEPLVEVFIMLDEDQIEAVNINGSQIALRCCSKPVFLKQIQNLTNSNQTIYVNATGCVECNYWCMPMVRSFGDGGTGLFWIIMSLICLLGCLFCIVKILSFIIVGPIAHLVRRAINAEFSGKLKFLMQVILFFVSIFITLIIQSSNIVVATLVPLCAMGIISLQRVYVMSVGANVGTTITGILSAFTQPSSAFKKALQLAFVYVLFNVIGAILWLPIPFMRLPKRLARKFGNVISEHKWLIYVYVPTIYFVFPLVLFCFALIPHWIGIAILGIPILILITSFLIIFLLRKCAPQILHQNLKTFDCLPIWIRSLSYWDTKAQKIKCLRKLVKKESGEENIEDEKHDDNLSIYFPNVIRRLSAIESVIEEARVYTKRSKIVPKIDLSDEEYVSDSIKEDGHDNLNFWHSNQTNLDMDKNSNY